MKTYFLLKTGDGSLQFSWQKTALFFGLSRWEGGHG